ncbi:MAG: EFR1 family ferrodoxin [Eubacteriales bacterium]|nr:EFR1 family ferrodoxin [Eubacteriales bacterium]
MVFYFTATGNSLYAAKSLEETPVSIPQAIHAEQPVYEDERIGVVCPIFGHLLPPMVQEFLKKARFKTDYFYMVLTYGMRHGGAAELAEQFLRENGITPSYINTLQMVDNFLPGFDMDEQRAMDPEKHVEEHLAQIGRDIMEKRCYIQPATDADRAAHQEFLSRSAVAPADRWKDIYTVTNACIGCGICTRVCPSGCWQLKDGRAVYQDKNCQCCMACIHSCPQKAIQMTIPEKNPQARYRNEHIKLAEIIAANHQN